MSVYDRFKDYDKEHCWQYDIKLQNLDDDLKRLGWTKEYIETLTTSDLEFFPVLVSNFQGVGVYLVNEFIQKNEWLSKMPNRPTHRFVATHKDEIAGAVVMAIPYAFSANEFKNLEKLIARGASASWAPKNIGSWLIMKCIDWMVHNTQFRLFTGYADPEAKELGTIYQACNFLYLGQKSGVIKQYFDPLKPHLGWFSSRNFRHRSNYTRYAKYVGIELPFKKYSPDWDKVDPDAKAAIKAQEETYRNSCLVREVPQKHKYALVRGEDKRETKRLLKAFHELYKTYPYPKERGK